MGREMITEFLMYTTKIFVVAMVVSCFALTIYTVYSAFRIIGEEE